MENKEFELSGINPATPTTSSKKFETLLMLERIMPSDLATLDEEEYKQFCAMIGEQMQCLKGLELDVLRHKIEYAFKPEGHDDIWEANHVKILDAMDVHLQCDGRFPSKSEIARFTGMSRSTVVAHLKDYDTSPHYKDREKLIAIMAQKVMGKVARQASQGDFKSQKLYLNIAHKLKGGSGNTHISNQNNYIQINKTVISQEALEQLNPQQLNQIEKMIVKKLNICK